MSRDSFVFVRIGKEEGGSILSPPDEEVDEALDQSQGLVFSNCSVPNEHGPLHDGGLG